MSERLKPPPQIETEVWVDEAIWGHRFRDDQSPWLVLLEFFAVFHSRYDELRAFNELRREHESEIIEYSIPKQLPLQRLVFNNPYLYHIANSQKSEGQKWIEWLDEISKGGDYEYLKERFSSFTELAQTIEIFQTTAIEPHGKRRWSSRFLFPYGPNCIYADLHNSLKKGYDRRFFARGGELLYLMLCRSGKGSDLSKLISKKLMNDDEKWNRVVGALVDHNQIETVRTSIGYLPFTEHSEYGELAETWLQLLNLNLPYSSIFDPLMRLSALHMLLYMLRRSNEEVGEKNEPKILFEIASPSSNPLRELSIDLLKANQKLSVRALRAYIESITRSEKWQESLRTRSPSDATLELLNAEFRIKSKNWLSGFEPDVQIRKLRRYAEERHSHVGGVHLSWATKIGLVVSRTGVGRWYSPDDALLKALVICLVENDREEYYRFLKKLYERFRIVVSVNEVERAYGSLPTDQIYFLQNAQRLESRLAALGLLRRLSDDCAYVINPFNIQKSQ